MVAPGVGTFTYGLRGIACLEARLQGPERDLHSGIFGGAVMNPNSAIARLAATLHQADGRVAIEGFYDDVKDLEPWERQAWQALGDGDAANAPTHRLSILWGEPGWNAVEQRWGRPTAEINGIGGGWQGAGSKTVIPREAMMKRVLPSRARHAARQNFATRRRASEEALPARRETRHRTRPHRHGLRDGPTLTFRTSPPSAR